MQCKDMATAQVCYAYLDGGESVHRALVAHYEYAENSAGVTLIKAIRYTTADGVPVDTSDGVVTVGACPEGFRDEVCIEPYPEDLGDTPNWSWALLNPVGTGVLNSYGTNVSIQGNIVAANSATVAPSYNSSGFLGGSVARAGNTFWASRPGARHTFTVDGEAKVILNPQQLQSGAAGTTGGLFGGNAITALGFPVDRRPIAVPVGVHEIAPNVWASIAGNLNPTDSFIFEDGALTPDRPFVVELYSANVAATPIRFKFRTTPFAKPTPTEAIREVDNEGRINYLDPATLEPIAGTYLVVDCNESETCPVLPALGVITTWG